LSSTNIKEKFLNFTIKKPLQSITKSDKINVLCIFYEADGLSKERTVVKPAITQEEKVLSL
jgi:hypothetical protein